MLSRGMTLLMVASATLACDPLLADDPAAKGPASPDLSAAGAVDEGGEEPGPDECAVQPAAPRPRVLFVLDRSDSMGLGARESAPALLDGPSRWARAHALVQALSERLEGSAEFGAALFPSSFAAVGGEAAQCDVLDVPDVAVGPWSAAELLARLPAAEELGLVGASPATQAMWTSLEHVRALGVGPATTIVLVTDGGANCADEAAPLAGFDEGLEDVVAFARDELGVVTLVVGAAPAFAPQQVPAVDAREALREIALAGGAPSASAGYYDVDDVDALASALTETLGLGEPGPRCP